MLKDKVIVVTGGAGLLGRTFCDAIVSNSGKVIIAEHDYSKAESASKEVNAAYADEVCFPVEMDITSPSSVNAAIKNLKTKFQAVDAVVNNAYPRNEQYGRQFFDVEYEDFCENTSMHLGGYFLVSQRFMKFFSDQGRGNIINIASIYGVIAPKFEVYTDTSMTMPVEYAVIKSGLIHLTKYMAKYAKNKNIRVNAISPGGIENGQDEKFLQAYKQNSLNKGMLSPGDIKGLLIFLLSDLSVSINGQNIVIDDGFSL